MKPLAITAISSVNALGRGLEVTAEALRSDRSGLHACDYEDAVLDTFIGRVAGVEEAPLAEPFAAYDCRNNRLAHMALTVDGIEAAVGRAASRYGANRIAIVLGTSTSGVREGEYAFARRCPQTGRLPVDFRFAETQDHHSLATFVQAYLKLSGPSLTVSTACSSSAKVFADAAQMIEAGVCDAALVGGADSLCLMTLYGFRSLELLAAATCRPNDAARAGLSIGEGAGFAVLERLEALDTPPVALFLGYGESADAYHMSAPHPEGLGAELAMRATLERAGLAPREIDYINQHGTGTRQNDQTEDAAITRVFGPRMRCSSTKGATGHTLGAAGIIEVAICVLAIRDGLIPGNVNLLALDPDFSCRVEPASAFGDVRRALSNSFGFGGSNCSLLFGRAKC